MISPRNTIPWQREAEARFALLIGLLVMGLPVPGRTMDTTSKPAFYSSEAVNVSEPFALRLISNGTKVKAWVVQWGDGSHTRRSHGDTAETTLSHTYRTAGVYRISVSVVRPDGRQESAVQDNAAAVAADGPVGYLRLGGQDAVAGLPALPWGAAAASPVASAPILTRPADRFSAEFWLCSTDFDSRQDIISSPKGEGTQLYIAGRVLSLELPNGAHFSLPLPAALQPGVWHHIAVCYDRVRLFPYQNVTHLYVDGILAGEQHLDLYDTGAVAFRDAVPGAGSNGSYPLKGAISDLALYDGVLPPHSILRHAGILTNPEVETVMAVPATVKPFTVDAPRITRTIAVPLDPTPGVDNGPALRAAIVSAAPGTRLRIVNKATGKPEASSYSIDSLDKGNDWSAIRVIGRNDLEIDGGGATLVFGVNCRQFLIEKCQRVAFRNFSIDLDQKKYRAGVYARILSMDTATGDARFQFVNGRDLSPDRTVPGDISMWRWRGHDPKTLRIGHGPFFKTNEAFEKWPVRDSGDASILTGRIKPSYIATLEAYRKGANFFMINNARFQNTPVGLWECEQVTFDRVNFYASLGMVFLSGEVNHLSVTGCKIGLPPGLTAADRPLAACADGYHFHDTQGYVLFENNEIALTDDDPISIKDGVWRDIKQAGPDSVTLRGAHPGDEFVFYRPDFSPLDFRATVVRVEGGIAQLDRKLPASPPESFIAQNTKHHTDNWIIKDSYLHDYYGRLLICAPHGLITGNEIDDSYVHLGANDASFDSSGIASEITVENNFFVDTDVDTGIWGADSSYPVFQGMTFVGNSFDGDGIHLRNADAPLLWGNYFERKTPAPRESGAEWNAVMFSRCSHPAMVGNLELNAAAQSFTLASKETEGLFEQYNTVLQAAGEGERAMKRNIETKDNTRNRTGFTLVEVCLAMSIMVFATTAMIGLLSSGLNRLGGSIDANQGQNIVQQVLLEARQMPFPQLAAMGTYKRYFTYEGDMSDSSSAQTVYTANVTVGAPTAMPGGGATSSTLATMTVEIRKTPAGKDVPANPAIAHYVSMSSCRDLTLLVTGS